MSTIRLSTHVDGELLLSPRLEETDALASHGDAAVVAGAPSAPGFDLTPSQTGMLLASMTSGRRGVYVQQIVATVEAPLDLELFERCWQVLIDRHAALRTSFFFSDDGKPLQRVSPGISTRLLLHDLQDLAPAEQEERLSQFLQADRQRGFDFGRPPLMRVNCFQLADSRYRWVWTFSHLILDARSHQRVLSELLQLYEAFGNEQVLPPVKREFHKHVEWLAGVDHTVADSFWRQRLPADSQPTNLPRLPYTPSATGRRGWTETRLSAEQSDALHLLAQCHGLTINTLLQAAWALLLSRATGQAEVTFGVAHAGRRTAPDADGVVGVLVHTLPLRIEVPPDEVLLPWLRRLRELQLAMRPYEHTPPVHIREIGAGSHNQPLFESLVVCETQTISTLPTGAEGSLLQGVELHELPEFPVALCGYVERELRLRLYYDDTQFSPEYARQHLSRLEHLLTAFPSATQSSIKDVMLLDAAQRRRQIHDWNETAVELPKLCVHDLFTRSVAATPDAMALIAGSERLTYRQMAQRVERLSARLAAFDLRKEELIGVHASRTADAVISMLAILQAGAAYLPIDPAWPAERVAFVARDVGLRAIVAPHEAHDAYAHLADHVLTPDDPGDQPVSQPAMLQATPESLAYVIYTSGSTGNPKGVMIEHGAAVNTLLDINRRFDVGPHDRVFALSSFTFDLSVYDLFGIWAAGGTVVLPDDDLVRDPMHWVELIEREQVTVWNSVPALMQLLVNCAGERELLSLRLVLLSGDWIPLSLPPQAKRLLPHARLISLGGATEGSVWSIFHPIESIDPAWKSIPYGRALANQHFHVLDDRLEPCPVGAVGELYIGGAGVARGYLNRPELNHERFLADPFGLQSSRTLYRTGDLGRYWPDGTIEFLGRADNQAKLNGYRIELGEIEAKLSSHVGVRQAVAAVRRDDGGSSLLAFVVCDDSGSFDLAALRSHLERHLPAYMVPARIMAVDDLPLSANGKVDRRALMLHVASAPVAQAPDRPWTQVEELLGGLWRAFFHIERVSLSDSFLQLGADSLRAAEMVVRIQRSLGVQIPLSLLLTAGATLQGVAGQIESQIRNGAPLTLPAPQAGSAAGPAPLSYPQQQMWLVEQLVGGTPAYNVPLAFELRGSLDKGALKQAMTAIVERHAIFRTRFVSGADGQPCQQVETSVAVDWRYEDLRELPLESRFTRAEQRLRDEACRTFDLAQDVLLRGLLLTLDDDRHQLLLTMHHITCDGASLGLLFRELSELYAAISTGRQPKLAPLRLSCVDYARWQRESWTPEALSPALDYWRSILSTPWPALDLPTDRPRPARQTFAGKTKRFLLDRELRLGLERLARSGGATPFMALLTALEALLARYSGHDDLVIGVPVAGRHHAGLSNLIGYFANVLAIRADVSGSPSFRQLLSRVRTNTLESFAYEDLPFEMLVNELGHVARPSAAPLFQVLFAMQPELTDPLELAGLEAMPLAIDTSTAKFDLVLLVQPTERGWEADLEYNTDLFDDARIDLLASHLQMLLTGVIADPDRPLHELSLATHAESELLESWSRAPVEPLLYDSLQAGFEAQAARTPDLTAAQLDGQLLSYGDLNARANQLAHRLIVDGLRPGDCVGICLPRSFDLLVAVLGVVKAGGVCVPLDPAYPAQRLQLMLSESRASVVMVPDRGGAALFDAPELSVVDLAAWRKQRTAYATHNPDVEHDSSRLAYVLFTSGSTGVPKGVAMPHAPLCNLMSWQTRRSVAGQGTRTLQFASISFDVAFQELFSTWWTGGELVVLADQQHRDLAMVHHLICQAKVERLFVPFVALQHLAAIAAEAGEACALREIITAGEQLQITPEVDRWLRALPGCTLENQYGPTETHVATACRLPATLDTWPALPPIGQPIAGAAAQVLDGRRRPQLIGLPGELYLGGICLAQGYVHRPELTAERFVTTTLSGDGKPDRLYRTGDLCRWRVDGQLEFLGRVDQQVKIRGYRVEPGEVEQALLSHPDVIQCVATTSDSAGPKRLLAFVKWRCGSSTSEPQLREYLQELLPDYLVPSEITALPSLPRLPNGKIDRRALAAMSPRPMILHERTCTPPRTELETSITNIWQDVLQRPKLGIDDDFFDLGGDSLTAAIVFARMERDLGQRASLDLLLRASTVRQLAAHFQQARSQVETSNLLTIQAGSEGLPLFCVPGIGGHLVNFRSLSRRLSPELPMYGLKPQLVDRLQQQTVSEIAADYLRALESVQRSGPYHLLGFSFGGLVAYEMAQQLHAAGRSVGLLAIMDVAARWQPPASILKRISFHLRYLLLGQSADRWGYLKQRLVNVVRSACLGPGGRPEDYVLNRLGLSPESQEIARAHWHAYQQYAPAPFTGRVVVFRSKWQPPTASPYDHSLGWGRLAQGGSEVHELPGTHSELFTEPNLGLLAGALRTHLPNQACLEPLGEDLT